MKREVDQLGRFMNMVVDYKHKIGFKGPLLIEPKPREPTKHQYATTRRRCTRSSRSTASSRKTSR